MGLFGAMTTSVSGLQAQAFAMQNISGNIANSQTIAYKGINTSFEELIPGVSVASQQTAGGVFASSVGTNSSQGAIQSASSSTAMAINGDGYFTVQSPLGFTGNTPNFGGVDAYTRRGDFALNAQGYLVNGSGYYLEGTPIDPTTGNPVGTAAAPLQFQSNFLPANPTTTITYGVNLPQTPQTGAYSSSVANSELINPTDFTTGHDPTTGGGGVVIGADASTFLNESVDGGSVTVYTANGTPATLQLRWAKTDSVANGGSDTWNLFYQTEFDRDRHEYGVAKCRHRFRLRFDRATEPADQQRGAHRRYRQQRGGGQHHDQQPGRIRYPIRQHEWNRDGQQHAAERLFGRRAAVDFSVQHRHHLRHLHQRTKRRARLRPVGALQQPE